MMAAVARRRRAVAGALLAVAGLAAGAPTANAAERPAATAAAPWAVNLAPYLWAPSVDASLRFGSAAPGGAAVSAPARDLLDALDFGVMAAGEARRGRFSLQTDLIYLGLTSGRGVASAADLGGLLGAPLPVAGSAEARTRLRAAILGLGGGVSVAEGAWGHLDATAGVRVLALGARTDLRLNAAGPGGGEVALGRRLHADETLADALVGVRGRLAIGGGFGLPFAADVGTGSSRLTWQAMAGVSYRWGVADITLGYRALGYEGRSGLLRDATFAGPFLSAGFRF